jgi:hypothetical protein
MKGTDWRAGSFKCAGSKVTVLPCLAVLEVSSVVPASCPALWLVRSVAIHAVPHLDFIDKPTGGS